MVFSSLEQKLNYVFKDKMLLQRALTHRSHNAQHNERLEFLGDSVLNCGVAHLLFEHFHHLPEGDLSRVRANLVKQATLFEIAKQLEISQYLRLGEGELKNGGAYRPSILADAVEAILGAVFLDANFEKAQEIINILYTPILSQSASTILGKDAKTLLQEFLQSVKRVLPIYEVIAIHGMAHNQQFEVECFISDLNIRVIGKGANRRSAEQEAAQDVLVLLSKDNEFQKYIESLNLSDFSLQTNVKRSST